MFGHSHRGPAGHFLIVRPGDTNREGETLQCVHCGKHWIREPGSGRRRGFCLKCHGVTCGGQECVAVCLPFEARIDLEEGSQSIANHPYRDAFQALQRLRLKGRAP